MRPRLLRAVAGLVVALLAGLLASGCTTVRIEASDALWTEHDDGSVPTATRRVGDIEAVVALHGPDGECPLDVVLRNYATSIVPVRIDRIAADRTRQALDHVQIAPTESGDSRAAESTETLSIPACVDGMPGELHVALSRTAWPNKCFSGVAACRYRRDYAGYEVVATMPDGESILPIEFEVDQLVADSRVASCACDIVVVTLLVAGVFLLAGAYMGGGP